MAEGQFLGKRGYFLYGADNGSAYVIQTDDTLGRLPGTGLVPATDANVGDASSPPKRFKLRGVHWQGTLNNRIVRKFIVCNSNENGALYRAPFSVGVTIDGVPGVTTGRRGEVQSFANLPSSDSGAVVAPQ